MPSGAEYEGKITSYDWNGLVNLWSQIESGNTPGWDSGKALLNVVFQITTLQLRLYHDLSLYSYRRAV